MLLPSEGDKRNINALKGEIFMTESTYPEYNEGNLVNTEEVFI